MCILNFDLVDTHIYLLLLIIFCPQLVLQCSFSPWFLILRSIVKRGRAMIPMMDTTTASCTLHRWFANKKYRKGKNCHEIFADAALIIWKQKVEKSLTNIKRLIYVLLWNLCCPWPLAPAWQQLGTPEEVTIFAQSRAQQMHPLFLRSSTTVFCQCPMHCFMEQVENVWPFCLFVEYQSLPSAVSPYLWYRFYNSVHWI